MKCYNIKAGALLFSLQRGWDGGHVKNFLLDQEEVEHVQWESKKYYPAAKPKDSGEL